MSLKQNYALLLLLVLASCTKEPQTEVEEIYTLMEGSFTSEKQAEQNPNYYDISLQLAHIWEDREGKWVYAEYGLTSKPDIPYSQRVYQLVQTNDNSVEMKSFDLKKSKDYVGMWKASGAFETLTMKDLLPRNGCTIYFKKKNNSYLGQTRGVGCNPGMGKANYWTHQFTVSQDRIINWARGYGDNDSLIWGRAEGGYILEEKK